MGGGKEKEAMWGIEISVSGETKPEREGTELCQELGHFCTPAARAATQVNSRAAMNQIFADAVIFLTFQNAINQDFRPQILIHGPFCLKAEIAQN